MKKAFITLCLIMPAFLMAQNKTTNHSKVKEKINKSSFIYMIMTMSDNSKIVESPKRKKKSNVKDFSKSKKTFSFKCSNKNTLKFLMKNSLNFKSEMEALNFLGKAGWELVDINEDKFYFKSLLFK
jgi:hypothetical protein